MPAIESQGTILSISTVDPATSPAPSPDPWVAIGQITSIEGPSGDAATIDVSHLGSTRREKIMGLPDDGELNLSGFYDPADTGQAALRTARDNRDRHWFRLTNTDSPQDSPPFEESFSGFVASFALTRGVDQAVGFSSRLIVDGVYTF
jgi:hypothetical protein